MKQIEIKEEHAGKRLDKFLIRYLSGAGNSFIYKMLRKKNITLNDKKADGAEKLTAGDQIKIYFSDETLAKFTEDDKQSSLSYPTMPLDIVYEDADIMLVNKPAGLLTQKAGKDEISLNEYIIGYLLQEGALTKDELAFRKPSVTNRLDRNTSGLVAAGKTIKGLQVLSELFKERTIKKFYYCLVKGQLNKPLMIEGYLKKDEDTNTVQIHTHPVDGAGEIKTAYEPLAANGILTALKVELITGRSHQIRAHLKSIGHEIAGDYKYGDLKLNRYMKRTYGLSHQLLHAQEMIMPDELEALPHLAGMHFQADLPMLYKEIAIKEGLN